MQGITFEGLFRQVVWVCFFAIVNSIPANVMGDEWTDLYLQRPAEELELSESIYHTYGDSREVIVLNGSWQARKNGEESWSPVVVPGAFDFEGEVEFKRIFYIDSTLVGASFTLVCFGINNRCTVFVNGEFVGGHVGGHTSFELAIDSAQIRIGAKNEIQILVDSTLLPKSTLPLKHHPRILHNYGGIFRDIFIVAAPYVSFEDLQLRHAFFDQYRKCRIAVKALIGNKRVESRASAAFMDVSCELRRAMGDAVISRSHTKRVPINRQSFGVEMWLEVEDLAMWSPEVPAVYEFRIFLAEDGRVIDEILLPIGFKDLTITDRQFLLNGRPFAIHGVDWYEDFPYSGPVAGWKTIREEVLRIKELGANTLRIIGTPPHPYLLNLCDELGLLVFLEMPLTLVPEARFEDQQFFDAATGYFQEMLKRDSDHVSLAAWGLGSDLSIPAPRTAQFMQNLQSLVRNRSNHLTYSIFRNLSAGDSAGSDFTIVEHHGRNPEEIMNRSLSTNARKPVLASIGYRLTVHDENASSAKNNSDKSGSLLHVQRAIEVQELQAYRLQRALKNVRALNQSPGFLVHTFADWTEARPNLLFGRQKDPLINQSGLVDVNREKRIAYNLIQSEFRQGQPLQMRARSAGKENPIVFPIGGIILILLFLYNFNRSRRLRANLQRIFKFPHGFYTEIKENRKIPLGQTVFLSLVTCAATGIIFSSIFFKFRSSPILNDFLNLIIESDDLKLYVIWLIWQPIMFFFFSAISLYLSFIALVISLKIISFVLGRILPIRQYFTLVAWVFSNFVWLLPIVPIYYRLIRQPGWTVPALALLALFGFWSSIRLFRSIKVVYTLGLFRAVFLVAIVVVVVVGGLGWYYDSKSALSDYLPIYWKLVASG